MKRSLILLCCFTVLTFFVGGSCKSKKPNNVTSLTIQTTPASGSVQAPAPGPDFPLVVTVTSTMPVSGVKIDVTARAEGSTINFFSASQNTANAVTNFVINGAPQGVTSLVEVTVTDLGDASIKATSSYRFARK